MLNLPIFTSLVIAGVILAWIVYTAAFLYVSRHYDRENEDR